MGFNSGFKGLTRNILLYSSDSLIPSSAGVKRQAGQEGNTAHAAPYVFSTFQKHYLLIRRAQQFLWSNSTVNQSNLQ